jgi:NADPH:quinone reductase-like Zn-dependent oxidoreductase
MKAVRIHDYGSVDVLKIEDIPIPEITENDLLIKVYATSVNPVDWKVREGLVRWRNLHQLPLTLGWDVSGVVDKTGSKVQKFKIGDEVYSRPAIERNGSYAEFIAVRESEVAFKPKSITHEEAASIPLVGLTVWESLVTTANIQAGQKVLIHAAAGGVGSMAVQIARIYGCYVIGTAYEGNIEFVKNLGAHEVIDYKNQNFSEILKDIDVVFDTVGGTTQENSWKVLKEGGMLMSIINKPADEIATQYKARSGYIFVQSNGNTLETLRHLIDSGKLKPVVGSVFSLDEIKQAQELSQSKRAKGKIVIKVR